MVLTTSDIINIVSAALLLLAISVSLGIGIKSILLTNNIERRKYRLELLNNIMDWGIDVLVCSITVRINDKAIANYRAEGFEFINFRDIVARGASIASKAEYLQHADLKSKLEITRQVINMCHSLILSLCRGVNKTKASDLSGADLKLIGKRFEKEGETVETKMLAGDCLVTLQMLSDKVIKITSSIMETELK